MFWPALMKARALLRRLWIAFLFCSGLLRWAKWRLAARPFPFWPERVVALWRIAECRGMTRQLLQMLSEEVEPGAPDAGRLGREKTLKSFIERLKTFSAEQRNAVMSRMAEYISPGLDTADTVDVTMTWQEIEGMACCGVTIGSHTLSHPILTRISPFEAQ